MTTTEHQQRGLSRNNFRDNALINQGDVYGNIYYGLLPHQAAGAEVFRVIPYPRNEDIVYRRDLSERLDKLLPRSSAFHSAALWGLGGSGKTQIALDYAYRRCGDDKCSVFWVHADNEATFVSDYKTIGKKLGVDERLNGSDLLEAVCSKIGEQAEWVMIVDNADDLGLFGVGRAHRGTDKNLREFVPHTPQGVVLWTSRDAHIAGTLVGAGRGIKVRSMETDEAMTLLARVRGDDSHSQEAEVDALLEELQQLPLAISQAGAYMRRMSMTAEQYLTRLRQGQTRWKVLKTSDADRHRRPEVSNSVLETWRISIERIREESEMSYRMLHVIAYVDSQDIPEELMAAAGGHEFVDQDLTGWVIGLEEQQAIMRLKDFSFINLRWKEGGERAYEMHNLVQEAVRYGLWASGPMENVPTVVPDGGGALVEVSRVAATFSQSFSRLSSAGSHSGEKSREAYYSEIALRIVNALFPSEEGRPWARCEQYMAHAIRVGEWAEVSRTEVDTARLLNRASRFLYDQGRWREMEPVDRRALGLLQRVLGDKHPDTITSMANLAVTYHEQGQYDKAEELKKQTLDLQRQVLGDKHPDTIKSMANLAVTYHDQGRYDKAEELKKQALDLQREVLGDKHPDTIKSMASLAMMYYEQGQYDKAEELKKQALDLQREVLGDKHPDMIKSMANLAVTYYAQGRYDKAEELKKQALDLRREVLGDKHPDTIKSMANLAVTYHAQGRYDKAEELKKQALDLRREVLGDKHPDTVRSMANLAATYHKQGRYDKAEGLQKQALDLQREVLRDKHPDTITSIANLAIAYHEQGRYDKAEELKKQALDLQREVLGDKHPDTIKSMANLAMTYYEQGRYDKAEELKKQALDLRREVLGDKHPSTITSMASLAVTYHAQGRYDKAEALHQTALDLRRKVLGEHHPHTVQSVMYLAHTQERSQVRSL